MRDWIFVIGGCFVFLSLIVLSIRDLQNPKGQNKKSIFHLWTVWYILLVSFIMFVMIIIGRFYE